MIRVGEVDRAIHQRLLILGSRKKAIIESSQAAVNAAIAAAYSEMAEIEAESGKIWQEILKSVEGPKDIGRFDYVIVDEGDEKKMTVMRTVRTPPQSTVANQVGNG